MNKDKILKGLIAELNSTLETLIRSAIDARDAATNEESKPENKYDTRGLEASYLAGAQAKRADELKLNIQKIENLKFKNFDKNSSVDLTALVKVIIDNKQKKWLFMLPFAGGIKVIIDGEEVNTITPNSPVGELIMESRVNDVFDLEVGEKLTEYKIMQIE